MRHKTIRFLAAVALLTGCNATAATATGAPAGSNMITLSAELLTFATRPGENIVIVKSGTKPADFRVNLLQL